MHDNQQDVTIPEPVVIHSYTRRQAIEDGVLVQLSGDGYQGDEWIPAMVQEAGFKFPIAMTTAAFEKAVAPIDGELPEGQDIKGRLWDVLWMLLNAIRRSGSTSEVRFELLVWNGKRHEKVRLKSLCGPGDQAEPVITIMLPDED